MKLHKKSKIVLTKDKNYQGFTLKLSTLACSIKWHGEKFTKI